MELGNQSASWNGGRLGAFAPAATGRPWQALRILAAAPGGWLSSAAHAKARPRGSELRRGFTLVELLLVMTLLVIVISIAGPVLANFFRGRTLDSEARRFLALTRSGQNRAVFEGIPMLLWVDVEQGRYGLEAEPGWEEQDGKAVEFKMDQDLRIEVVKMAAAKSTFRQGFAATMNQAQGAQVNRRNVPQIRFLPDGSFDETSPQTFRLSDRNDVSVYIGQDRNRLNYEIRNQRERSE